MQLIRKSHIRQNYFIMLLLMMNSLNSTILFTSNLYFLILSILVLILFALYRNIRIITPSLMKIVLFLAVLFMLYILKQWDINPLFMLVNSLRIFLAYLAIRILKRDGIFYYLKEIVYYAALISIPLFILQLINFNFTYDLITSLQNSIPLLERDSANYSNVIFWGIRLDSITRNSGFMWEPGAFAAMLIFPIYIQFQINNFKFDRRIIIFLIALLTTTSTMGYIAIILLLIFYLQNTGKKLSFFFFPIFLVISFFIFQLDFVLAKIQNEFDSQDKIEDYIYTTNKSIASLGRIGSFRYDFNEWKSDPIIGKGGSYEILEGQIGTIINRTNGLSRFLVQFGLVGIFFYFLGVYRSFYYTSQNNKKLSGIMSIILLLVLSFSNELLAKPLFFSFAIIYLVDRTRNKLNFSSFSKYRIK